MVPRQAQNSTPRRNAFRAEEYLLHTAEAQS